MLQHILETGQRFTPAARRAVWEHTRGQPWLVNALCAGACFDSEAGRDRSRAIDVEDVNAAREELILSRRTHLDQLAHKLEEERVRRVVEPNLAGGDVQHDLRDLEYARDLGLLAPDPPPRMANPIYAEVVPRELGYVLQDSLDVDDAWYVDAAGVVDLRRLLTAFATFYGENAGHWLRRLDDYREAAPQLILQAYLQRIVNGGGRIEREYGLGRGRTDLLVLWPREAGQPYDLWRRLRDRVQGAARFGPQELGGHRRAGRGADPRLHGQVRRRGGASGRAIAFEIPHLFVPADASDHVEQEVLVVLGAVELAADGSLVGMHPGDVQCQPADHRQTGGGVALAVARLVFVHRHVEHPVQAVLDRPVGADGAPETLGRGLGAEQMVAAVDALRAVGEAPLGDHLAEGRKTGPVVALLQPVDVVADRRRALLDAPRL